MSSEQFLKLINIGHNILITGPGGTGKTYTLRKAIEADPKNFVLTSSTGISAQNLDSRATTIHSFSGINVRSMDDFRTEKDFRNWAEFLGEEIKYRIIGLKRLVIDEISMMSPGQIDLIDKVFKKVRIDDRPFGGVQLIFSGDFLQLPPVVIKDEDEEDTRVADKNGLVEFKRPVNYLAFESKAWKEADIKVVQLTEIKRTDNKEFAEVLCRIRNMTWTMSDYKYLKSSENHVFPEGILPVKFFNSNKKAEDENNKQLDLLKPDPKNPEKLLIKAKSRGDWEMIKILKKNLLALDNLWVKVGCRVMIIVNRSEDYITPDHITYVNGSTGTYLGLEKRITTREVLIEERDPVTFEITNTYKDRKEYYVMAIKLDTGPIVYLKRKTWEYGELVKNKNGKYQYEAEYSQYPVRLGYAFTIHKSQGMSIDYLEVDCKGIRTDNQFYVAVSRARRFEGLRIINLKSSNITACQKAIDFYKQSLQ